VLLLEKNPLNLEMKYQKVMKRMQERMRRVLPSLVHRGYPEMNLSMIILFSFFPVNPVALTLFHALIHALTLAQVSLLYFCLSVLCFQDKTT